MRHKGIEECNYCGGREALEVTAHANHIIRIDCLCFGATLQSIIREVFALGYRAYEDDMRNRFHGTFTNENMNEINES